ncbi:MAG: NAD+ synthase [Verrucomicrobia bacterium]|nr:NAD+ synthase [Verrucomicrobiota bacterium]
MSSMRIALAQINLSVGNLEANRELIVRHAHRAAQAGASVIAFPELSLSGYPPEDLILKPHFISDCARQFDFLADELPGECVVIIGSPLKTASGVANAALVFSGGSLVAEYKKIMLPNYGVFDEQRVFIRGREAVALDVNGLRIGLHICEDSWLLDTEATAPLLESGVDLLLNLSASPFHRGKLKQRESVLRETAAHLRTSIAYCNLVGGQDELVFDGGSMLIGAHGEVIFRARQCKEEILLVDVPPPSGKHMPADQVRGVKIVSIDLPEPQSAGEIEDPDEDCPVMLNSLAPPMDTLGEVYHALELGLRDYVDKNGFKKCIIAVSGGIDSALVTALAVDALGADRVAGVTMPSQYTSDGTLTDAQMLAQNLGIEFHTVAIRELYDAYIEHLSPLWSSREPDITEENLQARIRGGIVMALSNKFGWLVLSTGNKSEMATGYCTLYGDMVGGFAVIKDVPKTLVFELCRWRNRQGEQPVIPPSTIDRPPSAELRPDQRDTDSLPAYDQLDPILERYIERDMGIDAIIADGFDAATVKRVVRLVDLNEYKRRQGPPGIKITPKAFGRDRRMPITNQYRDRA